MLLAITGIVMYGGLNMLLGKLLLPGSDIIAIRPQLVIPVAASLLLGPFAGGMIGLWGNFLGDLLSGYGVQFWHWSVANFIIGFMPGMVRWLGVNGIKRVNEFAVVLLFIFLGNVVGLFEGFLVHILLDEKSSFQAVMNAFYLPALISNTYLLVLLMPPLLAAVKFLKLNIETRTMFFVLVFSLIIVTILSAVFMGIEHGNISQSLNAQWVQGKDEFLKQMISKEFRWIGVMLIFIVISGGAAGYHFSRKYMQPINRLTEASDKLKNGDWSDKDRIDPGKAGDDMESLIDIFNNMAQEIQKREMKMNKVIMDLKLQMDQTKDDKIFTEITETDFFKKLEKKSREIRKTRKNVTT